MVIPLNTRRRNNKGRRGLSVYDWPGRSLSATLANLSTRDLWLLNMDKDFKRNAPRPHKQVTRALQTRQAKRRSAKARRVAAYHQRMLAKE